MDMFECVFGRDNFAQTGEDLEIETVAWSGMENSFKFTVFLIVSKI
jgi:hypothetical protein